MVALILIIGLFLFYTIDLTIDYKNIIRNNKLITRKGKGLLIIDYIISIILNLCFWQVFLIRFSGDLTYISISTLSVLYMLWTYLCFVYSYNILPEFIGRKDFSLRGRKDLLFHIILTIIIVVIGSFIIQHSFSFIINSNIKSANEKVFKNMDYTMIEENIYNLNPLYEDVYIVEVKDNSVTKLKFSYTDSTGEIKSKKINAEDIHIYTTTDTPYLKKIKKHKEYKSLSKNTYVYELYINDVTQNIENLEER